MPLLIGLDEAGYGPNLGPLVVAATVWEVRGDPRRCDPWSVFEDVVSQESEPGGRRVQIADSKQVHSSAAGIAAIERSATVLLRLAKGNGATLFSLWDRLVGRADREGCGEPWFCGQDVDLPIARRAPDAFEVAERWSECCAAGSIRLVAVACDIVPAASRFNEAVKALRKQGPRPFGDDPASAEAGLESHGRRASLSSFATSTGDGTATRSFSPRFSPSRCLWVFKNPGSEAATASDPERCDFRSAPRSTFRSRPHPSLPNLREACMEAFNRFWLAPAGVEADAGISVGSGRAFCWRKSRRMPSRSDSNR